MYVTRLPDIQLSNWGERKMENFGHLNRKSRKWLNNIDRHENRWDPKCWHMSLLDIEFMSHPLVKRLNQSTKSSHQFHNYQFYFNKFQECLMKQWNCSLCFWAVVIWNWRIFFLFHQLTKHNIIYRREMILKHFCLINKSK